MEYWEFSSFKDYIGLRNGILCNQELARNLLKIDTDNFYENSYKILNQEKLANIWLNK